MYDGDVDELDEVSLVFEQGMFALQLAGNALETGVEFVLYVVLRQSGKLGGDLRPPRAEDLEQHHEASRALHTPEPSAAFALRLPPVPVNILLRPRTAPLSLYQPRNTRYVFGLAGLSDFSFEA